MKNFIIEVSSEDELDIIEDDFKIVLKLSDYQDFVQLLKKINSYDSFQENITFQCDQCNSFILSTKELHCIIEKVVDFLDNNSSDLRINVYDSLWDIKEGLKEVIYLTDKEWNDYYTVGLPDINFIYEKDGQLLSDSEGNHLKYVADQAAFKFKSKCKCDHLLEKN